MKETTPVAPYLFAQVMGSYIGKAPYNTEKSWGVGLPLGAGINWRLTDDLAFQTSAGYTFGLTEDFTRSYLLYRWCDGRFRKTRQKSC